MNETEYQSSTTRECVTELRGIILRRTKLYLNTMNIVSGHSDSDDEVVTQTNILSTLYKFSFVGPLAYYIRLWCRQFNK